MKTTPLTRGEVLLLAGAALWLFGVIQNHPGVMLLALVQEMIAVALMYRDKVAARRLHDHLEQEERRRRFHERLGTKYEPRPLE